MLVEVDAASPVPPFVQLYEQIAEMAASGSLPRGARLPAVRQLASDLGVAPGTVARTYRELERDGIIETRGRHGSFVRAERQALTIDRQGELHAAAHGYAVRAHHLGVSAEEAVRAVLDAIEALGANQASPLPERQ